jgi:hypothetical protein
VSSEKTIATPFGRLLATVWVLFGILISAFVTSVIASTLTTDMLSATQVRPAGRCGQKKIE